LHVKKLLKYSTIIATRLTSCLKFLTPNFLKGIRMMITQRYKQTIAFLLLSLMLASPVMARDITMEQQSTTNARNQYDAAKSDYDATTQQIAVQEKRVADEQMRLKALQDKQVAALEKMEATKAELDVKVKALEKAWEERDK
jgi:hypothetical protein